MTQAVVAAKRHGANAWACVVLACVPAVAQAIAADTRLADLQRSAWTRLQGVPANIDSITRTSDGMLWLVGAAGVHRFDGVRFHPFASLDGTSLAGTSSIAVQADANGGLWLGQSSGEILYLRGDSVTRWPPVAGLHRGALTDLAVGEDGRVWVVTQAGLSMRDGDIWRGFGEADGLAAAKIDDVLLDVAGRAWVLASDGVYAGEAGNTRFVQVESLAAGSHLSGLMLDGDALWRWTMTGDENLCRLVPRERRGCWKANDLIFPQIDADGALWWRAPDGLSRLSRPDDLGNDPGDLTRLAQTVSGRVDSFAFGVDGSVWLSGSDGIVRLRDTPLQHLRTPGGAVVAAKDDGVWLGSFTRGLMRIGVPPPGTTLLQGNDDTLWTQAAVAASADLSDTMTFSPPDVEPPPGTPAVLARYPDAQARTAVRIDADGQGGVRVATLSPPRLVHHDGRQATDIPLPELQRGALMRGSQRDANGDLWIAVARNTVPFYRLQGETWQAHGGIAGVDRAAINGFTFDRNDAWIAIANNSIGRVQDGAWTRFGPDHDVSLGMAIQPLVHDGQVWVAGTMGFQGWVGDRFVALVGHDGDRFVGASGAVQLDNGDLWLNGVDGLSRIARNEREHALRDATHRVAYTRLDHFDGNMSGAMQGAPMPTLALGNDGTLWASTDAGLLRIDPARIRPALAPPLVQLLTLRADDARHAIADGMALPVGAARIALTFATPPTDHPERIRVRYRLRPHGDWVDAGERREVVYEALPPGDHVFEVVASDRDGRWGARPTRLEFVLPPRFHQTTVFHGLVVLAVLALLATFYAIRMRQVSERARRDTTARLHERMRISRDLHDSLLQNVQALHMHVQAIAARVPDDDPLRPRIDLVLDRAHDAIREGRDRIGALRDPLAGTSDLADCLQRIAHRLAQDADAACEVHVASRQRPLQPMVYDELLQIGREALANALRHADATRIVLRIAFDDDAVCIIVTDDGTGLPADALEDADRDGHFGLRGMRERAALMGAELRVRNVENARGAEIAIRVPAHRAYPADTHRRGWLARLLPTSGGHTSHATRTDMH